MDAFRNFGGAHSARILSVAVPLGAIAWAASAGPKFWSETSAIVEIAPHLVARASTSSRTASVQAEEAIATAAEERRNRRAISLLPALPPDLPNRLAVSVPHEELNGSYTCIIDAARDWIS